MTVYERIKTMTEEEMRGFCYWIYLMGNTDGEYLYCDSPGGYFGGYFLGLDIEEIMPNNDISFLQKLLEEAREGNKKDFDHDMNSRGSVAQ